MAKTKKKPINKLNKFISEVTFAEGKKVSVSVGNVREVLSIANKKTKGLIYAIIRTLPVLFFCLFLNINVFSQTFTPHSYWHFDGTNTATTIQDAMGNFNMTGAGGLTVNTGGPVDKYGTLTSATGLLTLSNNLTAFKDSFAIAFLWRPAHDFNVGTSRFIITQNGDLTIEFVWPTNNYVRPYFRFYTRKANGQIDDFQVVLDGLNAKNLGYYLDGNWHHFVFQYNCITGTKQIWVDGKLPSGFSKVTAGGGAMATATTLWFNHGVSYVKYRGDIDELAIYPRPLSAAMIARMQINWAAGDHYDVSSLGAVPLVADPITGPVRIEDYPRGHTQTLVSWTVPSGLTGPNGEPQGTFISNFTWSTSATYTALQQLDKYPWPRYKSGHTLYPNINVSGLNYAAGHGQTVPLITSPGLYTQITHAQKRQLMVDMSILLVNKYNMTAHIDYLNGGNSNFSNVNTDVGVITKLANDSSHFPFSAGMYRVQQNPSIMNQSQPDDRYIRNGGGAFLSRTGTILGPGQPKIIRFTNATSLYNSDGLTMRNTLQALINAVPNRLASRKIDLLWENSEWYPKLEQGAVTNDPVLESARIASGLDWYTFASRGYANHAKQSWPDQFMTLSGLNQTKYMEYGLTGSNQWAYKWKETRFINSPQVDGDYLSATDYYIRYPYNWRNWTSADHGIHWSSVTRSEEISTGDKFNAPFVCAGWQHNEENNVRPGQYLGFLKIIAGMGAKFFYNSYFGNLKNPFALPGSWIWQKVHPVYAQAPLSYIQSEFYNSSLLVGDMPLSLITGDDSSFLFYTGDLRAMVTIRKVNGQEKYLLFGTLQNNTNMADLLTDRKDVLVKVPTVGDMIIEVRRQGSMYVLDRTNLADVKFYQLDGWHEALHPDWWSNDIYQEAELYDATTGILKTTGISGTDYSNTTSFVRLVDGETANYRIQRNGLSNSTRYFWMRARSTNGAEVGASISFAGTPKSIQCIDDMNWGWYRINHDDSNPISYNMTTTGKYDLVITAQGAIDIDQIAFLEDPGDIGETLTNCAGVVTASITPPGPSTICAYDAPLELTASLGTSYLWSTGATTQAINVNSTGSYTVTVTVAGVGSDNATSSVTVNPAPVISPIANVTNICPADSVSLADITVTNTGEAGTKTWHLTLADAIAGSGAIVNDSVGASGKRYVRIVTAASCFDVDSVTIVINSCACANPPTAYAGPAQSLCVSQTVTTAGSIGGGATASTWTSMGTGSFSNTANLATTYFPSVADYTAGNVRLILTTNNPDGGSCVAAKDTVLVTFNALPSAAITASGATTFCAGGSVGLSVPVSGSYLWSTGATTQSVTVSNTGTYTVTVTSASGCTKEGNQVVTVNAAPVASITATGSIICSSGSVSLTAGSQNSYVWSTGASTQSINVSNVGSYTVTVSNTAGCTGSTSYLVVDTCIVMGCIAPYNLTATNITFWSARLNFDVPTPDIGITLTLRNLYTGRVTVVNYRPTTKAVLAWGLRWGTTYEYYFTARCTSGNYVSVTRTFKTKRGWF